MPCVIEAHDQSYRIHDPGGIIGKCVRKGRPYEAKMLERVHLKGLEGTAVDVGAGVGNHTLWFAAICGLKVHAFEPLDWDRLKDNVKLNPDLDITWHPKALGDENHGGVVRPAPAHVTGRALNADDQVPIRTLDSYELDDVVLLKIDVEGMEPEVLKGARETIHRCHPVIYAEAMTPKQGRANAMQIPKGYEHVNTFGATPLEEWRWRG